MSVVNMYGRDTIRVVSGLGDYVKRERSRLGLSQIELAKEAGIQQPNLSDIERGRNQNTSPDTRRRLAAALGVSHLDLLIAAGELTADEVVDAGKQAPVADDDDRTAEMVALVRQVDWSDDHWYDATTTLVGAVVRDQRQGRKR